MLPALAANGELPAVRHLIVLPSPALSGIPIEALIEARPLPDPPLLVSYAPSGTTFAWLSERRRDTRRGGDRSRRLLALGDPVPRVESDAKPLDHNRQSSQPLGSHIDSDRELQINRDAEFEPLPASRAEVSAIANLFDHPQVFLGSDASEQTLDAMRANGQLAGFDVIHLAAHGKADEISLFNCRLLLAQDRLPDPLRVFKAGERFCDGVLTAGEVLGTWKIDAEIVTLSACRSGVGRQGGGEGFVGFAQAFFLAGAQSLLVSLWEVDDQATSLLMTRFYENWLGKRADLHGPLTKAASLDEAKRWLRGLTTAEVEHALERNTRGEIRHRPRQRQGRPFAHPHDWAGFILMGNAS
jgi:CHAT domain-containing protein